MNVVYSFANSEKSKVLAIVDADKFGPLSFGMRGYIEKDGAEFALAGKTLLVIRNVSDEFKKAADEKLKGIAGLEALPEAKANEVAAKVTADEEAAQDGLGSIFG